MSKSSSTPKPQHKKSTQKAISVLNSYFQLSLQIFKGHEDKLLSQQDIGFINTVPMFRGKYKCFKQPEAPKELNNFKITNPCLNTSPFDILHLKPNRVQQELLKANFNNSAYLFNISCGGGKTLISVEWIHRLKLKTLIISARSAVNDQWLNTLQKIYPTLSIQTRTNEIRKLMKTTTFTETPDIFIITPQYLSKFVEDFQNPIAKQELSNFKFDLIIYDEIHSLLSDKYSQVLILPFVLKMLGIVKRIPLLLGLTASLPSPKTSKYQLLESIFGKPISLVSEITKIPVDFIDFRDLVPESERKFMDCNYIPLKSNQAVQKAVDYMIDNNIKPSVDYKLIIMTAHINDSVYAACYASQHFDLPVVLVRTDNEDDYYFEPDSIPPEYSDNNELGAEDSVPFTLESAIEIGFMEPCKYQNKLNNVAIIVSTTARLKEGFNCENICFGICTEFVYSDTGRIQILGRIRRSSANEKLNNHTRLFIVNSGPMPSNLKIPKKFRRGMPVQCTYDFNREEELFYDENYNRYDFNTYQYKEFRDLSKDRIIDSILKNPNSEGRKQIIIKRNEQQKMKEMEEMKQKEANNPYLNIHPLAIRDVNFGNDVRQNMNMNMNQNMNMNVNQNINQMTPQQLNFLKTQYQKLVNIINAKQQNKINQQQYQQYLQQLQSQMTPQQYQIIIQEYRKQQYLRLQQLRLSNQITEQQYQQYLQQLQINNR